MIITYFVECYNRTLNINLTEGYEKYAADFNELIDMFYYQWNHVEEITDEEERAYAHDCPLEEYLMNSLEDAGYVWWDDWWVTEEDD